MTFDSRLLPWVGEEPGEVMHAVEVANADGVPVEDHCPVVIIATKGGLTRIKRFRNEQFTRFRPVGIGRVDQIHP